MSLGAKGLKAAYFDQRIKEIDKGRLLKQQRRYQLYAIYMSGEISIGKKPQQINTEVKLGESHKTSKIYNVTIICNKMRSHSQLEI